MTGQNPIHHPLIIWPPGIYGGGTQPCFTTTCSAEQNGDHTMIMKTLHDAGIRSEYAYTAGMGSIALSFVSWGISRLKSDDSKAQSDRWGIFVGHWAPTFMSVGLALAQYEQTLENKKK